MTDLGPDPTRLPEALSAQEAEALAARHGLRLVGVRPSMGAYLKDIWHYRHLAWSMARGEFVSEHRDNYLGLVWAVLNPILLGVAYYLIFGVLLGLKRDVGNFIAFLTIGLFTFVFFSAALTSGAKALVGKVSMMRSLAFPRVLLPAVVVLSNFVSNIPAFLVLLLIAVLTGEPITWSWLLFPVALGIVGVMGLGMAMIVSRVVHAARDLANLVPLIVRLLRYVSGVFFSIEARVAAIDDPPVWIGPLLEYQPAAVALTVVRQTLMSDMPLRAADWIAAGGWAIFFLVAGFVVFWRAEGTYGRA
ncbi:ABC transporter permease [Ornithinimicrobium humiphilum]|uniref:Transport permease protein n=1 Tax=Ornithinimicrobium humiphilum TaxID=125288 RepID=A0A543KJB8_9MICO|nr:ABC transporter permease [Ornithinimicrobium humiphilum]TQM95175.1 teichoic acid transport system permease protein [Ornithinimicrobium humiphilum]